jgi:hypothetical protein
MPAEADPSSFSQCPCLIRDKLDPYGALPARMKTQNENAQLEGPGSGPGLHGQGFRRSRLEQAPQSQILLQITKTMRLVVGCQRQEAPTSALGAARRGLPFHGRTINPICVMTGPERT